MNENTTQATAKTKRGQLVIKLKDGRGPLTRIVHPRDLDVTLDGQPLPPYYKLNLILDTGGVVRCEVGIFPSSVEIDAPVMASFSDEPSGVNPITLTINTIDANPEVIANLKKEWLQLEEIVDRVNSKRTGRSE